MNQKYKESSTLTVSAPSTEIERIKSVINKELEPCLLYAYKVYISGQISGWDYYEARNKFAECEPIIRKIKVPEFYKDLKKQVVPINPMELPKPEGLIPERTEADKLHNWELYMQIDLAWIRKCDAIFMQKCWINSKGAILELKEAIKHGKRIYFESNPHNQNVVDLTNVTCYGFLNNVW